MRALWYKVFIASWMLLCVMLSFVGQGRQSGIHFFYFENWQQLSTQIRDIALFTFLGNLIWSVVKIALFSLSVWGIGISLLAWLNKGTYITTNPVDLTATAFILGQGLYSIVLLLPIVTTQQLPLFYSLLVLLGGLLLALIQIRRVHHEISEQSCNALRSFQGLSRSLAISSLLVMVTALGYSSSRLSYDAASHYFAQAKILADSQQFISLSFKDIFAGSALHLICIYAALIQLFGDQTARLYSWVSGLAILAFSWALGRQLGLTQRARTISLSLMLTSTALVDMLGDGKIDLANLSVTLAAIYWFIESLRYSKKESFLIAGFFTGYSLLSRPYNIVPLGTFLACLLCLHLFANRERLLIVLREMGKGLFPFLFPLFLWLLVNLAVNQAVLQDPFAQFRVFEQTDDTWPFHMARGRKWLFITLYPLIITFTGLRDTLGFISPLFVAFLPLFLSKEKDRFRPFSSDLIRITLSALFALYIWIIFFGDYNIMEVRYVFSMWVILFLCAAFVADNMIYTNAFHYYVIAFATMSALVIMAFRISLISLATYSPIVNGHFQCRHLQMCNFFEPVNHLASPGDRVLVLSAYRYYLRPDLFVCSSVGEDYKELQNLALQNQDEFWKEVYSQGYRYIIYDSFFVKYILRFRNLPSLQNPPPWLNTSTIFNLTFTDYNGRQVTEAIYRIDGIQLDISPHKTCISQPANWVLQTTK